MTVTTLNNSTVHVGNDVADEFDFEFKVLDVDHLVVERRVISTGLVDKTYAQSEYSVTGIDTDSGSITLLDGALSSDYELIVTRIVPYTQELDIVNQGGFYPETVEEQLDLMVMAIQQIGDIASRALTVPPGDAIGTLPAGAGRANMFLGFDAAGEVFLSTGGGADDGLRTDLALATGADLISYDLSVTGSIQSTVRKKLMRFIDIMDFIPVAHHAGIRARTNTTDLSVYFAAAIAYIDSLGGATLFIPAGTYNCNSAQQLCRGITIVGNGPDATIVQGNHTGTAGANSVSIPSGSLFKNVETINGSHRSFITIQNLTLKLTNAANLGACFYDQCSTYLVMENVNFTGGLYGLICDQTEVSRWINCRFESQLVGGIGTWLVNGPDINASSLQGFTNQLIFLGCHWNLGAGRYAIVDDGGVSHMCIEPNINGGGLRVAGCNMTLVGGEYESVVGSPLLLLSSTRWLGGISTGAYIEITGGLWAAVAGQVAIDIDSVASLSLKGSPIFAVPSTGGITACITGTANAGKISYDGSAESTFGASSPSVQLFDGYATLHYSPNRPIRTEVVTSIAGVLTHSNSAVLCTAATAQTYTVPPRSGDASAVAFELGTWIDLFQTGAGKLTVAASGVGATVTINAEGGLMSAKGQHTKLQLLLTNINYSTGATVWNLSGDRIA